MIRILLTKFIHHLVRFQHGQVIRQLLAFFFIGPDHDLYVARRNHGGIKKHTVHDTDDEPLKENNHGYSQCDHKNWEKTPGSVSEYSFG
uniref:Uncharacterized protein n=1 Tax=uncultured marine thaumarchaeote KM3_52_B01 TaxID=1456176 RepID=A0A075HCE2_9ARCH|nr:hypothetical protein [uncultured marine thaumarchaeote KM3_52_B01]